MEIANWQLAIELAGWLVSLVAVIGVLLNNHSRRECFVLWMASNTATAALHVATAAPWGLVARDLVFLVLAVHGWMAWGRKTESPISNCQYPIGRETGLELVSTDDLVCELKRRFDTSMFMGATADGNGRNRITRRMNGDYWQLMGLCLDSAMEIKNHSDRSYVATDGMD